MTLFNLRRLVVFGHYNLSLFIGFVCYYDDYVKNQPPNDFKVHLFPFDWVLGAMNFQLPLAFTLYITSLNLMYLHGTKGFLTFDI